MMTDFLKLKEIAGQAGRQNDCRIYDIYKHRDRLQVFIDKKPVRGGPSGIKLKDCENVFHSLQFLLNSELPHLLENRRLEVSSPGIEKPLREKWHFEESIGRAVKLTALSPITAENKKTGARFHSQSFTALLASVSKENIRLKKKFVEWSVPFSKIKSAKLVFEMDAPQKAKKSFDKKNKTTTLNKGKIKKTRNIKRGE